jgi:hypothetical protein
MRQCFFSNYLHNICYNYSNIRCDVPNIEPSDTNDTDTNYLYIKETQGLSYGVVAIYR